MKATSYLVWRVIPIVWLALGVCTPYASGQAVMNIQQATGGLDGRTAENLGGEERHRLRRAPVQRVRCQPHSRWDGGDIGDTWLIKACKQEQPCK